MEVGERVRSLLAESAESRRRAEQVRRDSLSIINEGRLLRTAARDTRQASVRTQQESQSIVLRSRRERTAGANRECVC
jgi:hypothetical protein